MPLTLGAELSCGIRLQLVPGTLPESCPCLTGFLCPALLCDFLTRFSWQPFLNHLYLSSPQGLFLGSVFGLFLRPKVRIAFLYANSSL